MEEKRFLKRKEKAASEGNREQLAQCCNQLGDHYNQMGSYDCAAREYQQEAQLYAQLGKELEMARAERMIGEMFMLQGEFPTAMAHINTFLTTVRKLGNKVEEQRAYATLGRAHLLHGQSASASDASAATTREHLQQAEKAFLRSLLLVKALTGQISRQEQLDMQARCYLNLGVVQEHLENFEAAIGHMEKAVQISRAHDIFELTHLCYTSMTLLYHWKRQDVAQALRHANLALEAAKRLPDKVRKICETLIIKAEVLIRAGDFASAKHILTKAYKKNTPDANDRRTIEASLRVVVRICQVLDELVATSSTDHAARQALYETLGDGCCKLQNYSLAIEYYQKMLECARGRGEEGKALMPIYVSLYQTYKDNKDYGKALEYLWLEYGLNEDEPAEAFHTLCAIAEVCERQRQSFWTVQDVYQKAKAMAARSPDAVRPKLERIVYARLRKLQERHKFTVLAEELAEEARLKGIDWDSLAGDDNEEEGEDEEEGMPNMAQNTPDLGADIDLTALTDSEASDLDETDKPRPHRVTRGARSIAIKRNNKGETQLHQACIAGNLELVRRLLDQGHVVNVRDHAGWIPLHEACNHGHREIVELLLDRGAAAAINDKGGTSCDGITPLHDACSNGFLDVVELLLARGADPLVKTDAGETCVGALDHWRRSATLLDGEQLHYEEVRRALLTPLSKVGIKAPADSAPLTNASGSGLTDGLSDDEGEDEEEEGQNDQTIGGRSRTPKALRKVSPRQPTATREYQSVMAQLKHPYRPLPGCASDEPSSSSHANRAKRSAFLDAGEVDDDSWLIDDVGPEKKRRRCRAYTPTNECEALLLTPETDAFQIMLESAAGGSGQKRQRPTAKAGLSRSSSVSSNSSAMGGHRGVAKFQASLLDSGFSRRLSEGGLQSDSDSLDGLTAKRAAEPDSTTTPGVYHLIVSPAKPSAVTVAPTVSFKVKVEAELLLVPVERRKLNEVNIRWLAEEAARRYYNLVGLKPVLRLKTADGFAYEESDPVNVAVEQSMILAAVVEWRTSPLPQRYEEMCLQLSQAPNPEVLASLERAQLSNVVSCADLWLTPQDAEPLCKALLHQGSLTSLDLANNFMQNDGVRLLAKSLPTLKNLRLLNLRCNFITCEGLEALLGGTEEALLADLEELNLSENPLGDRCLRILNKFCASTPARVALRKLNLSHCELANLQDFDLCYFQLTAFDISHNPLTDESLRKLLGKLNASRLEHVNLSYAQAADRTSAANAEHILAFFEAGTCERLQRVELAGCHLTDGYVFNLLQCLNKAPGLQLLDLSDNPKLSSTALQFVLEDLPSLRQLWAANCDQFLGTPQRLATLLERPQIPDFMALTLDRECGAEELAALEQTMRQAWHRVWGEKGKVDTCQRQVKLYVNPQDLNW